MAVRAASLVTSLALCGSIACAAAVSLGTRTTLDFDFVLVGQLDDVQSYARFAGVATYELGKSAGTLAPPSTKLPLALGRWHHTHVDARVVSGDVEAVVDDVVAVVR